MDDKIVNEIKETCILDCGHCDFKDIGNGYFRCMSCYFFDIVNSLCEMYDDQRPRTACMPICGLYRRAK
jgi:hypothetical protein